MNKRSPRKRSRKRSPRKRSTRKRSPRRSKGKSICWKGYHRVKGTAPYTKGSCAKN